MYVPDNDVVWSVTPGTTTATISTDGLLQASGTPAGNGTVWVKATSTDGSGVADSLMITISNQGTSSDFTILLVNDNANDPDRYLVIDTTLFNLGYTYDVYNTVDTQDFPDSSTLANYNLIIWYTGNDGVDLYLWDTSDTTDYKFNAPLKQFVDNGGYVWVQGLDFLYDIYGQAPDTLQTGQFVYDYMGIEEYHAQSKVDDGGEGLPEMDVVPNNEVCTLTPVKWVYSTLWYADAIALAPQTEGIYTMGPDDYIFSDYYCAFKKELFPGVVITFTIETARIDTRENTEELFHEVIEYLRLYTGIHNNTVSKNEFTVYPNPAGNFVVLKNSNAINSDVIFQLYDINGRKVNDYTISKTVQGNMQINISGLPYGLYIYRIVSGNTTQTGKLLKHQ
jgi:hypothetical protein